MSTGTVIEFKRLAVHDGPGIRTTLFLKGCPLRCVWCHNPESLRTEPESGFFSAKCAACGRCAALCACHTVRNGAHHFDRTHCTVCGRCADACPREALIRYGREISAIEATEKLAEDLPFYEVSGGGATLSGGEPLLQAEFCAEVFELLKARGIHTALDSCGNVSYECFEAVLPWVDLVLFDLKGMDSGRHRRNTGSGNGRILENLQKLDAAGVPLEIRMPIVPGRNDDDAELAAARKFLASLRRPVRVRLLAFHDLSRNKYAALARPAPMERVTGEADLPRVARILCHHRLEILY